ncbi:MAG: hypothetical protein FWG30_05505 [Eubacteriaceae bacterium]|nr:hypothetical protein [Eubacteriaceae bacterium]
MSTNPFRRESSSSKLSYSDRQRINRPGNNRQSQQYNGSSNEHSQESSNQRGSHESFASMALRAGKADIAIIGLSVVAIALASFFLVKRSATMVMASVDEVYTLLGCAFVITGSVTLACQRIHRLGSIYEDSSGSSAIRRIAGFIQSLFTFAFIVILLACLGVGAVMFVLSMQSR